KKYPEWAQGYVGAVPKGDSLWPKLKAGDLSPVWKYWVPWYNVHKTYAGLRDAWLYTGNEEAKKMFLRFCNWAINLTAGLSDEQMESMLGNEHGGINEVFADAYQMTGEAKYLTAAKRFSHKALLDPMAVNNDNLDNKHANTQVPKAVGFVRIGEVSGDKKYTDAGSFFWQTVTTKRSLAFGGNSRREFFPSLAASYDYINDVEGPETCNSHNMLKLTEDLFRLNPSARYADYYERTILNHMLSTQHPEHGGYVYFTPARPRSYRVYSAPNQGMWCCVGTGMENHGKYNQFIYTHSNDSLYLNLFVASELNWKEKNIKLQQQTVFPYAGETQIKITEGSSPFTLMVRYPSWIKAGALKMLVNGKPVAFKAEPSSYIAVKRQWKKGDVLKVVLPMHTTIEQIPNLPTYLALMHGPILLGAKTGTENLRGLVADDGRWSHIPGGGRLPVDKAPIIVTDNVSDLAASLVAVKGKPLHFTLPSAAKIINPVAIELQPFYEIHDARYMMYWMALSNTQYKSYLDSLSAAETEKMKLDSRTVDVVAAGEQQPEVDHAMQSEKSRKGSANDQLFREASNGGFFSYNMNTNGETDLLLRVRYWGAEWGTRKFEIFIDDKKLVTEDNSGRWNQSRFFEVDYKVPVEMVQGKKTVRVKFQAADGASAGPVYYVRLLKTQ
ncbi:MAG TPA: beta-L-arabinofuranosidase domain-containing protein, partial [Flavisolibacter sp.]|nr:beta-L-arabinofuranosidase domain-containing protein [Flavisolibacter sp.]